MRERKSKDVIGVCVGSRFLWGFKSRVLRKMIDASEEKINEVSGHLQSRDNEYKVI